MKEIDLFKALDLVPQPLIIVTAGDPETPGKRGGMTVAWYSRVSWNPPLIAISIAPSRYTYQLIKEYKAFAVNVVSKKHEKIALEIFGTLSGKHIDKFAKAGIQPIKAQAITAPIIPESPIVLECKLLTEFPVGDHVVVISEVVKAYKGSEDHPLVWYKGKCCNITHHSGLGI
ncbi:MAG: flavin reductase family protein [Ignisphaera sp.]